MGELEKFKKDKLSTNSQDEPPLFKVDLGELPTTIERIAQNYFKGQKDMEIKDLQVSDSIDARKHQRDLIKYIGNMVFVSAMSLIICAFAYGLIFQLGKFEYGVLLITHVIAFGAGYLGGKHQKQEPNDE